MDDGAQLVIDVTRDFGDHYAEIRAHRVPPSNRYPDGVKYSMQYGNAAGETIVRYDNFPDPPDVTHHHSPIQMKCDFENYAEISL
ncbi:MAG: DUF6516 family protein, partial [Halapricum sp.]